jgi:tRNA pseudouridine synthase 10
MTNTNLDYQIAKKAQQVLEKTGNNICPRCLGRIFSLDLDLSDNLVRGEYILNQVQSPEICYDCSRDIECYICHNIFFKINNELIEQIVNKINYLNIEFKTFLVGSRVKDDIIKREREIHETILVDVENIKKEINREIGKALELKTDKEVDFENPQLVILIDFNNNHNSPRIEFQINPLFIEGRYRKLVRGIPQTKWPCRKCKGRGCENCKYTGKMYQESVEELISPLILKNARGTDSKFHGAGREDIDVKMLGTGRPFVLEIKEPHKRNLNLDELENRVNQDADGKVEVLDLKFTDKKRRGQIKTSSTDTYKVYEAMVNINRDIQTADVGRIKALHKIEQRTPRRVAHRRADLIREREVRRIDIEILNDRCINLIIECQGGLYIKELISGDDARTKPSVSSILDTEALCVQLDVVDVHIQ